MKECILFFIENEHRKYDNFLQSVSAICNSHFDNTYAIPRILFLSSMKEQTEGKFCNV